MVTKELLSTWKAANDSVVIWIKEDKATLGFNAKVKKKGFEDTTVHKEFNGFNASLPSGFIKACASQSIYSWMGREGNWDALLLLLREGDELSFHVADNSNGYLKAATIHADDINKGTDSSFRHPSYHEIHNDTLWATIKRKGKTYLRNFMVANQQCPDNSARMLQRY